MAGYRSWREGQQSENIAQFLLYPLAFLSEPVKISDDIGVDFFCTLFEERWRATNAELIPLNSFAIQIKSIDDSSSISLTKQLQSLQALQVPYFIGVVDRANLTVTLYSGEYLTHLFVYKGPVQELTAELCERSTITTPFDWFKEISKGNYILRFPKITEIRPNMDREERAVKVADIRKPCSLMMDNLAAIIRNEYILKGSIPSTPMLYAGPGSIQFFHANFFERLAEAFLNLQWLHHFDETKAQSESDFRVFERIYQLLASSFEEERLPSLLKTTYLAAKNEIDEVRHL